MLPVDTEEEADDLFFLTLDGPRSRLSVKDRLERMEILVILLGDIFYCMHDWHRYARTRE
jgi:hypothetical protein